MPFGLTTFVPRTVPVWKPGEGRLRPTVSCPAFLSGGAAVLPASAGVAITALAARAAQARMTFFTLLTPRDREAERVARDLAMERLRIGRPAS